MAFLTPQLTMSLRAKIGVLYPEHSALDEEFWGFAAPGVTLLIARTRVQADDTVPSIRIFADDPDNDRTAQGFSRVDVDVVAYACTAIGFVRGPGGDEDLNKRMSLASRAPATCTITASIAALRALGVTQVAVATPYNDELNGLLSNFLAHHGIRVVNLVNLDLVGTRDGAEVNDVSLQRVRKLAQKADRPEAEAIYIPCTAFRTLEIIEALEEDSGKPVVSANQATIWHAQHLAGVHAFQQDCGVLMRTPLKASQNEVRVKSKAWKAGTGTRG